MTSSQGGSPSEPEPETGSRSPVARRPSASRGVERLLGVSRARTVSPYWFGDPSTPFGRPGGIPVPDTGRLIETNRRSPPSSLLSPSESTDPDRHRTSRQQLSWGSGPLQRLRNWKPGYLGVASPDTFRLQGFSPSCRFSSSRTFRPCFMPVTLMGFSLQGLSPSQSLRTLSGR
jgi:hypothetical protein